MNFRRQMTASVAICVLLMLSGCESPGGAPSSSSPGGEQSLERTAEKGPVKLMIRVTPQEPRLSDTVEMEICITAPKGIDLKAPAFGQAVGDFLVRDYSERSEPKSAAPANEPISRRFLYKLEPVHAGRHLIRSIAIEFTDNRALSEQKGLTSSIESEPFEVNVTSELGDKVPNLADLVPMLPPQPLSQSSGRNWLIGACLIAVIIGMAFWLRRRKKSSVIEPRRKTPEEIAHAALAALLAEDLPSKGLLKEFYVRLTGIVRQFIEDTTGLRAPEQTTEEFLLAMRSKEVFSIERSMRLTDFLEAADMVKYAGQQPDRDQIELSIARAREFVDDRAPGSIETPSAVQEV